MPEIREIEFRKLAAGRFQNCDAVLLYGTDSESIAYWTRVIEAAWKEGEVTSFSVATLADAMGALDDALKAQSLFGGRGLVVLRGCSELHAKALVSILDAGGWPNLLLIVADSLRKNSPLRAAAVRSKSILAMGFHAEDESSALRRIEEMAREKSLRLAEGAAMALYHLCGTDRELLAMELEKLSLLTEGKGPVTPELVQKSCGDQAASDIEALLDSVLSGNVGAVDRLLQRNVSTGDLSGVLAMLLVRLSRLSAVRAAVDSGLSWDGAFLKAKPPVFFGQQQAVKAQVSRLSLDLLLRLQEQVQEAMHQGRRLGPAGDLAVARSLMAMALRLSPSPH